MTIDETMRQMVGDIVRDTLRDELAPLVERMRQQPTNALPRYLSPAEAAQVVGVAAETIREWCRGGKLPVHRAGRCLRVRLDELETFLVGDVEQGRAQPNKADLEQRANRIVTGGRKVVT